MVLAAGGRATRPITDQISRCRRCFSTPQTEPHLFEQTQQSQIGATFFGNVPETVSNLPRNNNSGVAVEGSQIRRRFLLRSLSFTAR